MTNPEPLEACKNTDKEIWRQPTIKWTDEDGDDRGMEPSIFITKSGGVGFNHYGTCVIKTIEEWVKLRAIPSVSSQDVEEVMREFDKDWKGLGENGFSTMQDGYRVLSKRKIIAFLRKHCQPKKG